MDPLFLIFAASSAIVFTAGDTLFKYWSINNKFSVMAVGLICYLIAGILLAYSFKRKEMAVALAVLLCVNLIGVAIVGLVLFKETLGLKEIIGMSLAMIAIILLTL